MASARFLKLESTLAAGGRSSCDFIDVTTFRIDPKICLNERLDEIRTADLFSIAWNNAIYGTDTLLKTRAGNLKT